MNKTSKIRTQYRLPTECDTKVSTACELSNQMQLKLQNQK